MKQSARARMEAWKKEQPQERHVQRARAAFREAWKNARVLGRAPTEAEKLIAVRRQCYIQLEGLSFLDTPEEVLALLELLPLAEPELLTEE